MNIPVIDLHCDALLRMYEHGYNFTNSSRLDVNLNKLQEGYVKAQAFAIFIDPDLPHNQKLAAALKQVHYFQNHVISEHVVHIKKWSDFTQLKPGQIGAFSTISKFLWQRLQGTDFWLSLFNEVLVQIYKEGFIANETWARDETELKANANKRLCQKIVTMVRPQTIELSFAHSKENHGLRYA